jgi:glycosyltransferase involved in cell wall biosynthesis
MRTAVIIPAFNEAETVGTVVDVAKASAGVDEVIVVDDRSTDGTPDVAEAHGARVVRIDEKGKGQAMAAGVAATDAEIILFLDADLVGLRTDHVERLVRAVEAGAGMACGLFDRGPRLNPLFLHVLPILTGERALRRELFESLSPDDIAGYKIEAALNARVAECGLHVDSFVCDGMWHRTKEEKFSSPVEGFARKTAMLTVAMYSYLSYGVRRRLRRYAASP